MTLRLHDRRHGFSRGAFTVRTLAGMIGTCGLLRGEAADSAQRLREAVRDAYDAYRAGYDSVLTKLTIAKLDTRLTRLRHRRERRAC